MQVDVRRVIWWLTCWPWTVFGTFSQCLTLSSCSLSCSLGISFLLACSGTFLDSMCWAWCFSCSVPCPFLKSLFSCQFAVLSRRFAVLSRRWWSVTFVVRPISICFTDRWRTRLRYWRILCTCHGPVIVREIVAIGWTRISGPCEWDS